jgi:hypothetical protein
MIVGTGHSGQFGLSGQTGQVCLDRTARKRQQRQDSSVRRAVDKVAGAGQFRQGDLGYGTAGTGTARSGQPGRTTLTLQIGQEIRDRMTGTGQL